MKEEISLSELLPIISGSIQGLQDQLDDLKNDFFNFKLEVRERYNEIESNIARKNNFNNLLKILENKKIISAADATYLLISNNNYLNK